MRRLGSGPGLANAKENSNFPPESENWLKPRATFRPNRLSTHEFLFYVFLISIPVEKSGRASFAPSALNNLLARHARAKVLVAALAPLPLPTLFWLHHSRLSPPMFNERVCVSSSVFSRQR